MSQASEVVTSVFEIIVAFGALPVAILPGVSRLVVALFGSKEDDRQETKEEEKEEE